MKRHVPAKTPLPRAEESLTYYTPSPYVAARALRVAAPVLAVDLMYAYYGTE